MVKYSFLQVESYPFNYREIAQMSTRHSPTTPATAPPRSSLTRGSAVIAVQELQDCFSRHMHYHHRRCSPKHHRSATRLRLRSVVPPSLTLRSRASAPVLLWFAFLMAECLRLVSSGRAESEAVVEVVPVRRVAPVAGGHAGPEPAANDPIRAR